MVGTPAPINNTGLFRKSAGNGESLIHDPNNLGNLLLNNTGVVEVSSGTLRTTEPVAQVSGGTLTGGAWRVDGGATLDLASAGDLTTNQGAIVLGGENATFTNLGALANNGGLLTLGSGAHLAAPGNFANSGALTFVIGGRPFTGLFGQLDVAGQATLGGSLHIILDDGFVPTSGDSYPIMTYAGYSGAFAIVTGLEPYFDLAILNNGVVLTSVSGGADLAADPASLSFPASALSGQTISITYQVHNLSESSLTGSWYDSLYLSSDGGYDPEDAPLGRVLHSGVVGAFGSYVETLVAPLPGLLEGDYHVILIADSRHYVTDPSYANNYATSLAPLAVSFPELALGVPESGAIADGQDVYYRLELPPGDDALITADFDADWQGELYVGYAIPPDRTHYGWTAASYQEQQQRVLLTSPYGGAYYILLHGRRRPALHPDGRVAALHPAQRHARPGRQRRRRHRHPDRSRLFAGHRGDPARRQRPGGHGRRAIRQPQPAPGHL